MAKGKTRAGTGTKRAAARKAGHAVTRRAAPTPKARLANVKLREPKAAKAAREKARDQVARERERARMARDKQKAKAQAQAQREKARQQAERDRERVRVQKERERERVAREKQKAQLRAEREKEKERIRKEKEIAREKVLKEKEAAKEKALKEKEEKKAAEARHKAAQEIAKLRQGRGGRASKRNSDAERALLSRADMKPEDAEARRTRLKNLIKLGKERSYLTYAEINDHLPDDMLDAEAIENIIGMINDMGIQVYDEEIGRAHV